MQQSAIALICGYTVADIMLKVANQYLSPGTDAIGLLRQELQGWTEVVGAESLFDRIAAGPADPLVITRTELEAVRAALRPEGRLSQLARYVQKHQFPYSSGRSGMEIRRFDANFFMVKNICLHQDTFNVVKSFNTLPRPLATTVLVSEANQHKQRR